MANVNCSACEELRQDAPELIVNGLTDDMCTSLQNDTGLVPSNGNDDCTDLNNLNDCLVGNMETEVDAYNTCDWKPFMKKFIPNVWTTGKGIICALCGVWTNVHNLWTNVNKLNCMISYMIEGANFSVGEEETDGSYVVAGKGVSFYEVGETARSSDINLQYYGGMGIFNGSFIIHTQDFQDAKATPNFDNGSTIRTSTQRKGNSVWEQTGKPKTDGHSVGTELLYEMRIKRSEFPQLRSISAGRGQESSGGAFHTRMVIFTEGEYAHGQHGECKVSSATPANAYADSGHLVPPGYMYVQIRVSWMDMAFNDGSQYTAKGWCGIKLNQDSIDDC